MTSRVVPLLYIWWRMTVYGMLAGIALGAAYALIVGSVLAPQYFGAYGFLDGAYSLAIVSLVFGGSIGGMGGFAAGLIDGLVIGAVSVLFFTPMRNRHAYQFVIEGISVAIAVIASYHVFRLLLSTVRIPDSPIDQLYNVLPFALAGLGGLICARLTVRWYLKTWLAGEY